MVHRHNILKKHCQDLRLPPSLAYCTQEIGALLRYGVKNIWQEKKTFTQPAKHDKSRAIGGKSHSRRGSTHNRLTNNVKQNKKMGQRSVSVYSAAGPNTMQ